MQLISQLLIHAFEIFYDGTFMMYSNFCIVNAIAKRGYNSVIYIR